MFLNPETGIPSEEIEKIINTKPPEKKEKKEDESKKEDITRRDFLKTLGKFLLGAMFLPKIPEIKIPETDYIKTEKVPSEEKEIKESSEIIKKIDAIYLLTIEDGICKSISISKDQLAKIQSLDIKGYLAGILIFGNDKLEINFNNSYAQNLKIRDGGFGKNFVFVGEKGEESDLYHTNLLENMEDNNLKEKLETAKTSKKNYENVCNTYYSIGKNPTSPSYLGEPISYSEKNILKIRDDKNNIKEIHITHKTLEVIKETNLDADRNLIFKYLGNRPDILKTKEAEEKLEIIAKGANEIQNILNRKIISEIWLIDYNADNAFIKKEKEKNIYPIFINVDKLINHNLDIIKNTTEHEIIHGYDFATKFTDIEDFKKLFCEMRGNIYVNFEGKKVDFKKSILNSGSAKFLPLNKNKEFFFFINEKNFFGEKKAIAGHSHEDTKEFFASFIHSLIYLDNLEKNLNKEIEIAGIKKLLDPKEKKSILKNYLYVTERLINISEKDKIDKNFTKFLKEKLIQLKNINKKYEF